MPKSKRNKQIALSKTKKHGLEGKKKLFEEVRSCVETYTHLFIFSVNDMRNSKIKSVREQWRHSRFFIGKNKVMAKALGLNSEDEFRMNIHKIGRRLKGERGLLFSNQSVEEVLKWFSSYSEGDFARSGNRATETVTLQEGPLSQFPHNLEPYLRQLGLPTSLKKGIIHLVKDHTVCNVGDTLTPETAKIVKLLGYEMAEFYIKIECVWSQDGSFSDFTTGEESKENLYQSNSSPVSKKTSGEVAPMDIEEEVLEPSDEMIQNIIMKNRKSLIKNKDLDNEASSNESSDDEEMTDFAELQATDREITPKKSSVLSPEKFKMHAFEEKDTLKDDDSNIVNTNETPSKNEDSTNETPSKNEDSDIVNTNETPSKNEDNNIVNSNETFEKTSTDVRPDDENFESAQDDMIAAIEGEGENEKISETVAGNEITINEVESEDDEEEISELVEDTITDNKSAGEEKVGITENGLVNNTQTVNDDNKSMPPLADENCIKRLSLDKSALQSPVMLEKRPKFSPKMTRSAMKAKKTVSKTSNEESNEEKEPSRGRAHKRHSTGESPAERTLRNRSIKISKKKK